MPLYDYHCQACGARVEVMHKIAECAPVCPKCGADALKKQLSAPSFRLAGGGWYETDFKDKAKQDPRKLAGGAGDGKGEGSGSDGGSGESAAPAAASGGDGGATSGGDKSGVAKSDTGSGSGAATPSTPGPAPAAKPAAPSTPSSAGNPKT